MLLLGKVTSNHLMKALKSCEVSKVMRIIVVSPFVYGLSLDHVCNIHMLSIIVNSSLYI